MPIITTPEQKAWAKEHQKLVRILVDRIRANKNPLSSEAITEFLKSVVLLAKRNPNSMFANIGRKIASGRDQEGMKLFFALYKAAMRQEFDNLVRQAFDTAVPNVEAAMKQIFGEESLIILES